MCMFYIDTRMYLVNILLIYQPIIIITNFTNQLFTKYIYYT